MGLAMVRASSNTLRMPDDSMKCIRSAIQGWDIQGPSRSGGSESDIVTTEGGGREWECAAEATIRAADSLVVGLSRPHLFLTRRTAMRTVVLTLAACVLSLAAVAREAKEKGVEPREIDKGTLSVQTKAEVTKP